MSGLAGFAVAVGIVYGLAYAAGYLFTKDAKTFAKKVTSWFSLGLFACVIAILIVVVIAAT